MKVNDDLSQLDLDIIKENEGELLQTLERLEKLKQFKIGDYLICIMVNTDTGKRLPVTNSYNTNKKFKVVHVDRAGIPYLKEVGTGGKTRGEIIPLLGSGDYLADNFNNYGFNAFEFELDPHYVESVIFEAEENYDPVEIQKNKKKIRDEITKHNANNKIKTNNLNDVVAAFDAMQPGEIFWFSGKNYMTIKSTKILDVSKFSMKATYKKIKQVTEITVINSSSNKEEIYLPHNFQYKNLYKAQPRSYRELSDTI